MPTEQALQDVLDRKYQEISAAEEKLKTFKVEIERVKNELSRTRANLRDEARKTTQELELALSALKDEIAKKTANSQELSQLIQIQQQKRTEESVELEQLTKHIEAEHQKNLAEIETRHQALDIVGKQVEQDKEELGKRENRLDESLNTSGQTKAQLALDIIAHDKNITSFKDIAEQERATIQTDKESIALTKEQQAKMAADLLKREQILAGHEAETNSILEMSTKLEHRQATAIAKETENQRRAEALNTEHVKNMAELSRINNRLAQLHEIEKQLEERENNVKAAEVLIASK